MVTFPELMKSRREEKGMSLYQLAKKSGVSYRILQKLDRGEQRGTSIHKAVKICRALEIPSYVLMEVDGED